MSRRRFTPEDPDPGPRQADAELERDDPDPAHAGPAEATDDVADTRAYRPEDVERHPGELPAELADPPGE